MPIIGRNEKEYYEIAKATYINALKDKNLTKDEINKELDNIRKECNRNEVMR